MLQITFPGLLKLDSGLIKIIKVIWGVITQEPSKEIGETKQQNRSSSVEDVDKVQSIFEDYRGQVHREASRIEKIIYNEVAYYVEELNNILLQKRELLDKYKIGTKQIKKAIERILKNMSGNIEKKSAKRFL